MPNTTVEYPSGRCSANVCDVAYEACGSVEGFEMWAIERDRVRYIYNHIYLLYMYDEDESNTENA